MRGKSATQATMLTAVTPDALVPQGHPIRRIKPLSSPVPVVRSTLIKSGSRRECPPLKRPRQLLCVRGGDF